MIPKRLVYLILLMVLALNLPGAAREFRLFRTEQDTVSQISSHVAPLIAELPPYGEIGFQFDPRAQPDGTNEGTLYSVRPLPTHDILVDFTIIQYALAPRILINSTDYPQVIGCFSEPLPDFQDLKSFKNLKNPKTQLKHCTGGICLIQKGK